MRSVYKCAGNWIYIASLSFNRWIYAASISRLYYYFFFFFYNINFKEILVFLYISFDCWDPLLYSCQRYNKHIHLHRVAHREICISSSHRIMAEKRRRGSSATFFFFILFPMYLLEEEEILKYELAFYVLYTFVCVCVCVEISLWAWLCEKRTRLLIFRWRAGSIKKDFNPSHRLTLRSSTGLFLFRFQLNEEIRETRTKRKKKAHGKGQKGRSTPSP
jgi:hypothetical protein